MILAMYQTFINLSAELCGFSDFTLKGTGYAKKYFETLLSVIGEKTVGDLLGEYDSIAQQTDLDSDQRGDLLRARILSDERLGPIARNIIKLWYVSTWYELPLWWRDKFGPCVNDGTYIVSPYAYPEGLLWVAVGAHPAGAKAPGYGTWTTAPEIPA